MTCETSFFGFRVSAPQPVGPCLKGPASGVYQHKTRRGNEGEIHVTLSDNLLSDDLASSLDCSNWGNQQVHVVSNGMKATMPEASFPWGFPSRLAYVPSHVEPVGCGDRQLLMHGGNPKERGSRLSDLQCWGAQSLETMLVRRAYLPPDRVTMRKSWNLFSQKVEGRI